jgi:hypothetical protein
VLNNDNSTHIAALMCVFPSNIMKQVITSSDYTSSSSLSHTNNSNGCAPWHGCGVPHFHGVHSEFAKCVCITLSANINPSNTTFGVSKVFLM